MDDWPSSPPHAVELIERAAAAVGFNAVCDSKVGALLRTLATSVGSGRILELGTGPGLSTAWILDGMDVDATLITIEIDPAIAQVARDALGSDPRITFRVGDGSELMRDVAFAGPFDLIFADTWPGKYWDLDLALDMLAHGGLYVVDDMLPQPNWPDGHAARVAELLELLDQRSDLSITRAIWSTGVVLAARR